MKKRILSLTMALCILMSMFSAFSISVNASSTPSDWAMTEVNAAINEGLVTDKVTKDYQKEITREEFCELAVKLYEKLTGEKAIIGNDSFSDTDNTEILKAYSLGIVKGVSETEFAPNNNITRQELCVMLVRAVEAILDDEFILKYDFYNFDDNRDIAEWAFEQVYYAYEKGIIKGVGENKINPLGTATCEQAVMMVYRLHENIDNCKTVIPQEVIDRHENYTYVNNTFLEIEKKYTDEKGYVLPENIETVLNEVYAKSQEFIENGDIQGSQLNKEYLTVWVILKDGAYYIYTPSIEGIANYPQKTMEIVEFDNFPPFEVVTRQKAGNTAANKFDFCDYSYIDTNEKSISALKAKLSSLDPNKKCIIYWHGHGSVGYYSTPLSFHDFDAIGPVPIYSGVTLGIPEVASIESQYKFQSDIDKGRIVFFKDSYGLTPSFFDIYLSNVKSGLFFAGACQSLCDKGELAKVFINKGFDTYIGSNMSVSTQYVNNFMDSFGAYLCVYTDESEDETVTVGEALQKAKEKHGSTDWNVITTIYNAFTGENIKGAEFFLFGDSDFRLIEPGFKTVDYEGEYIGDSRYYLSGGTLYKEVDGKREVLVSGIDGNNVLTNGKEVYYGVNNLEIKYKNLIDNTEKVVYAETVPADIKAQWSYNGDISDFSLNIVGINEERLFFYLDHTVGGMYLKGIDISNGSTVFLRDDMGVENGKMVGKNIVLFPYRRDASENLDMYSLNMDNLAINKIGSECFFAVKPYKKGFCYWVVSYSSKKVDAILMYHNFDNNQKSELYRVDNVDLGYFSYGKNTATYSVKNKKYTLELDDLIK